MTGLENMRSTTYSKKQICPGPSLITLTSMKPMLSVLLLLFTLGATHVPAQTVHDMRDLHIVVADGSLPRAEQAASILLKEEIGKRTGLKVDITARWPATGSVIVLTRVGEKPRAELAGISGPALIAKPEAFRLLTPGIKGRALVVIEGFDARGVLFGAGQLLRRATYKRGALGISDDLTISTAPDKPIRGHQLGYRNTANSYDAWTEAQFEQYIRELVVFGTNAIESVPIFDEAESPHFKLPPDVMNAKISGICEKYDLDYWVWVPAQFDLSDAQKRQTYLDHMERICKMSPRLDGVFFPGGDPGDNPPEKVWLLLKDIGVLLKKYHPSAAVWLSLQGFDAAQSRTVYRTIQEQMPDWLGGLVTGPSSPIVEESRAALPSRYKLRYYPDLTHNVRCDLPIPWWSPWFNFTMGRESVNPRPRHYTAAYRFLEPYMDGFISYSDGVHDDVNKIMWTRLAWDRNTTEREAMVDYGNFFFGSALKEEAADGLLALESNWQGPAASNGGISATWQAWRNMELLHPELSGNWRWQMYLLRANYDAYVRARGLYESSLEDLADDELRKASITGSDVAITKARAILGHATDRPVVPGLRQRVVNLCDTLYHSISLQTSVKKYKASGSERGAVLDFIDYPLNNRWWMEDRFDSIKGWGEAEKIEALKRMADWEHPGAGSYYDDIGDPAKSPHVSRVEGWETDPLMRRQDNPGFDWYGDAHSSFRQSWMTNMRWPVSIDYSGLDTTASYTVRVTGLGECLLKVNGKRLEHTLYDKRMGGIKEFPVPADLIHDRKISVSFDDIHEDDINWRQQSRVTEIWLIRKGR